MKLDTILKRLEVDDEGGSIPNRWMNTDIKPVEAGRRTWGFWTFHNFCTFPPIKMKRRILTGTRDSD